MDPQDGAFRAGSAFTLTALRRLLTNIIYTGAIRHKGQTYQGEHTAILAPGVWERAQERLVRAEVFPRGRSRNKHLAMLNGLLHCECCAAPMVLFLAAGAVSPASADVIATSNCPPPASSQYAGTSEWNAPGGPYILRNPIQCAFTSCPAPLTTPSTGQTTETNLGGGNFQISSFFDIFTDLRVDGGATWTPANAATHMTLGPTTPEPSSFLLLGLGLAAFGFRRSRRV